MNQQRNINKLETVLKVERVYRWNCTRDSIKKILEEIRTKVEKLFRHSDKTKKNQFRPSHVTTREISHNSYLHSSNKWYFFRINFLQSSRNCRTYVEHDGSCSRGYEWQEMESEQTKGFQSRQVSWVVCIGNFNSTMLRVDWHFRPRRRNVTEKKENVKNMYISRWRIPQSTIRFCKCVSS